MIDESSTPSLRELIEEVIEERMALLMGPQPGTVTSYDPATQLASVQPLVMSVRLDDSGNRVAKPRPQINDVPMLSFGGGGGRITAPVKVGDTVLLVFCGVHIDRWMLSGGIVDPGFVDPEKNVGRISDVVAISGIADVAHLPTTAPIDALVLHALNATKILLGGIDATDPVVRRSDLASVVHDINTHTHPVATTGSSTAQTGTAAANATASTTPACSPVVRSK